MRIKLVSQATSLFTNPILRVREAEVSLDEKGKYISFKNLPAGVNLADGDGQANRDRYVSVKKYFLAYPFLLEIRIQDMDSIHNFFNDIKNEAITSLSYGFMEVDASPEEAEELKNVVGGGALFLLKRGPQTRQTFHIIYDFEKYAKWMLVIKKEIAQPVVGKFEKPPLETSKYFKLLLEAPVFYSNIIEPLFAALLESKDEKYWNKSEMKLIHGISKFIIQVAQNDDQNNPFLRKKVNINIRLKQVKKLVEDSGYSPDARPGRIIIPLYIHDRGGVISLVVSKKGLFKSKISVTAIDVHFLYEQSNKIPRQVQKYFKKFRYDGKQFWIWENALFTHIRSRLHNDCYWHSSEEGIVKYVSIDRIRVNNVIEANNIGVNNISTIYVGGNPKEFVVVPPGDLPNDVSEVLIITKNISEAPEKIEELRGHIEDNAFIVGRILGIFELPFPIKAEIKVGQDPMPQTQIVLESPFNDVCNFLEGNGYTLFTDGNSAGYRIYNNNESIGIKVYNDGNNSSRMEIRYKDAADAAVVRGFLNALHSFTDKQYTLPDNNRGG